MNELQIAKEVFLSIIKWFLLFIFFNNLVWGVVYVVSSSSITGETFQDGTNNHQEVSYGE